MPKGKSCGNQSFDEGIAWLCEDAERILDFGCGNGVLLFLCANHGTRYHIGIDASEAAIRNARAGAEKMQAGEFYFCKGDISSLRDTADASLDGVILSNILDQLYPEDANSLLLEIHRILKTNGKLLVKLNPYLTQKQIVQWGIRVVQGRLLDDGLLLLNYTTEEWAAFFARGFQIAQYREILFPEYQQTNRLFCLTKTGRFAKG